MMRVKSLVGAANPVPAPEREQQPDGLSARALTELAALVGTPSPSAAPRRTPRRRLLMAADACTVATAVVAATAKGADPGRTVEVSYTTPGSGPETAGLTEGKEYVLLLDAQDDGRFTLVNTTQGVYEVNGGRAVAGADNDVTLSTGVLKALRLTS
ncbi:hypothetical protein ACWEJZ_28290 [Streptomyces bacillaris]